jgi:hypothetical protein
MGRSFSRPLIARLFFYFDFPSMRHHEANSAREFNQNCQIARY